MSAEAEISEENNQFNIDVIEESGDWSAISDASSIAVSACGAVFNELEIYKYISGLDVAIMLGDDAAIQNFNGQYRGKDKPTNVLSFPNLVLHPDGLEDLAQDAELIDGVLHLGDIILAIETILKEAEEQEKKPQDHLMHLVVHGVLHLFGFDHMKAEDAEIMEKKERDILGKLGIADPYENSIPEMSEENNQSE